MKDRSLKTRLKGMAKGFATRLPPRWFGYRFVRSEALVNYARRTDGCTVDEVSSIKSGDAPLPMNCDAEQLRTMAHIGKRSFSDVHGHVSAAPSIVSIPGGSVLAAADEWNLEHFSILTSDGIRLSSGGLKWTEGHRKAMLDGEAAHHVEELVWPWESWYVNHYHWLLRHVPKLAWIRERGLLGQLMLPRRFVPTEVHIESARMVGVELGDIPRAPSDRLRADLLQVVVIPDLHPAVVEPLRRMADDVVGPRSAGNRRLFVRRLDPGRRQIVNEEEVVDIERSFGFEDVVFETMSFREQMTMCREAAVIVGLHGAGLANAVFAGPGTHLVEIIDPRYPSPHYYELAVAGRLHYWIVAGEPVPGVHDWGRGNVSVAPDQIRGILEQIDA